MKGSSSRAPADCLKEGMLLREGKRRCACVGCWEGGGGREGWANEKSE